MTAKNTLLSYLYRDASNTKAYGKIIFAGPPTPELVSRLKPAFFDEGWFIARQVDVPSVRFEDTGEYPHNEEDHCLHEFDEIESTDAKPTDEHRRTFLRFVKAVEKASKDGWEFHD